MNINVKLASASKGLLSNTKAKSFLYFLTKYMIITDHAKYRLEQYTRRKHVEDHMKVMITNGKIIPYADLRAQGFGTKFIHKDHSIYVKIRNTNLIAVLNYEEIRNGIEITWITVLNKDRARPPMTEEEFKKFHPRIRRRRTGKWIT